LNSGGKLFKKGELKPESSLISAYEELTLKGFSDLGGFSEDELNWLQHIHNRYLSFYIEERRMHFSAMALVAVAAVILIYPVLTIEKYFLPLAVLELLLIALLVPYVFAYYKYEEGVRKKMREAIMLENARRLHDEKKNPTRDIS
jgi:hypothetical protein